MSQRTIELVVKTDFDGRENADLDLLLPISCFKMIILSYSCTQNDPKDNTFLMMYLETLYLEYYSCYLQNTDVRGKFGHDTGRRFLIVRGSTLQNYYAKTMKDRDLIFVALSS